MDRTLSLEFARVVEAAALRSGRLLGRGQKDAADGLAVDAMRQAFDSVRISGTVVIGEGEIDEAPMLYIGEHVGAGGPEVDIAVDPIELLKVKMVLLQLWRLQKKVACYMHRICTWRNFVLVLEVQVLSILRNL